MAILQLHVLVHGSNEAGHTIHGVTDQETVMNAWAAGGGRVIHINLGDSPEFDPYLSQGYEENGDWK